jgi:DNA-directed RNA polymerase beta subunit
MPSHRRAALLAASARLREAVAPAPPRRKAGGLTFGQMEVDAFAALGIAQFLSRIVPTTPPEMCRTCGGAAIINRRLGAFECLRCGTASPFLTLRPPSLATPPQP